jgi:hypothetical protein
MQRIDRKPREKAKRRDFDVFAGNVALFLAREVQRRSDMRVKPELVALLLILIAGAIFLDCEFHNRRPANLWDRKAKEVRISERGTHPEEFLIFTNEQKLMELRKATESIEYDRYGMNSSDGSPSYNFSIVYEDGTSNRDYFDRREWAGFGHTPAELVGFLETNHF